MQYYDKWIYRKQDCLRYKIKIRGSFIISGKK